MAQQKMEIEKKKCMTPKFRVSYPAVFEAKSFKDQAAKFSVVMIFDKKTDLKELKRAAVNAAIEKFGPREKWPKKFKLPFRDGDEERADTPGYENSIFVTATSKQRPGVVDKQLNPIISEDDFYAGCYARATLIAFAYDQAGNRGVSFSLQNIQKIEDGERFGGRRNAEDEFEVIDDGSNDPESYSADSASDGLGVEY